MAVTLFKSPPLFRKPKNVEIPKRLGVSAVVVESSNIFFLTLQDFLNPDMCLMFQKNTSNKKNIPDFRVSYYCGRTIFSDYVRWRRQTESLL